MQREPVPTEKEIIARLKRGEVGLRPLVFRWETTGNGKGNGFDGVVRVTWQKAKLRFGVECKRLSNPKSLREALEQVQRATSTTRLLPLVVVPFLDESSLDLLESRAVSGIDLCGNGLVIASGQLYVRRTGAPNRFRSEAVIKNVYRGASSVVARLFLAEGEFASVQDALAELKRRGGDVTLPTVSKVCKALENDLIIERSRSGATRLRLIQPDKLLDRLSENYAPPRIRSRLAGKFRGKDSAALRKLLRAWADESGNQVALTGLTSVPAYAVMARQAVDEFYCSDVASLVRFLGDRFQETDRFATVSFLETGDETVYFDRRRDLTASPVQAFLELASGDKRERETAQEVRKLVLESSAAPVARR